MLGRIYTILQQNCQLDLTKPLVIGVSGGPDSLCLLSILHRLGYTLVVAHFNHGLRPDADQEAQEVERIAGTMRQRFIGGKEDVTAYADGKALSLEEAARILRYRFLFLEAERFHAQAVAVAHTADDQVETVLMHLLRGAGLPGLKGMTVLTLPTPWSDEIPLVRPLLSTWREEVLAYCQEQGLHPMWDVSNLNSTYFRNRLRHELIPFLEGYNQDVRKILWRTSQVLAEDYGVIQNLVSSIWQDCLERHGEGYVAFKLQAMKELPSGVQRHLLRKAVGTLRPGLRDLDYDTVERALQFLVNPSRSASCDLALGLRLLLEKDILWLATWEADLPGLEWPAVNADVAIELNVPGSISLSGGWELRSKLVELDQDLIQQACHNSDPYQAWVDASQVSLPLSVRHRRPGERFYPLGMDGKSVKLSDFMINMKIPKRARTAWPLICTGEAIVWVPGYHIGHFNRLTHASHQAVYLCLGRA